ncbi:MAG: hypothetical protein WC501_03275 [Candidatus Micrarchaeia archaeon]
MKAQSSLDFLTTYGWALFIVFVVIGAIFALGIFDIGMFLGSRTSGFVQVGVLGWELESSGDFMMVLKNNAETEIKITSISATLKSEIVENTDVISLENGKKSNIITIGTFSNIPSQGSSYAINVKITYTDPATGLDYSDTGTVTGKITS